MDPEITRFCLPTSSPLLNNFRDSMRRHYVDDFYQRQCSVLGENIKILDLGGNKNAKRGLFDIYKYSSNVIYLNYSSKYAPDVQTDASSLSFKDYSFDCIICAELFEHVRHPQGILTEVKRVLRPGGLVLLTIPFMFPIHPDPSDYGRFTDQFWIETLAAKGFGDIEIEWQGGYWCVFVDMLRGLLMEKEEEYTRFKKKLINWCFVHCQKWIKIKANAWDGLSGKRKTFFMRGCTTGFGICCNTKT